MLSYSWEKDKLIEPAEAMKNLAMAQLMAGTNTWDAQGHVMSGSNDLETRKLIFGWMKEHGKLFFRPRHPIRPIGVYFSQATRNYIADQFIDSHRGILMLLMQSHLEFQIITPRTLKGFEGEVLILPEARCLAEEERNYLVSYAGSGRGLVLTGETGSYDGTGARLASNPVHDVLRITDPQTRKDGKGFVYYPKCPGKLYYARLRKEFDQRAAAGGSGSAGFNNVRSAFTADLAKFSQSTPAVIVKASPFVSSQIASVDGRVSVFLANFRGLKPKEVARQIPEKGVMVTFSANALGTIVYLPFLGQARRLEAAFNGGRLSCQLPPIEKGAVVWFESDAPARGRTAAE